MAVAFDDEGTITNVIGMDNTETPGLGTKVQLPDFTDQFLGRTVGAAELAVVDGQKGDEDNHGAQRQEEENDNHLFLRHAAFASLSINPISRSSGLA